jgi:ParB-like chromosome segregation protein Spo0J
MKLLYTSIKHDGYTQPIVTIHDKERDKYVIVDGFHRYFICKNNADIQESTGGCVPIVVIQKDINDRMASTVRHNRARGKHSVNGMSNMVFSMLDNGWEDAEVCNHLGMEPEELLRLKHITGFSKLFADAEYNKAWVSKRQILLKKQLEDEKN